MKIPPVALSIAVLAATSAHAGEATLLRVFLADGTSIVSYGEYARVGDRVVFSMPLGGEAEDPALHLVNLPARLVDWDRTGRYADAARAAQYAATRGEADFALVTASVAQTLVEVTHVADAGLRLKMALDARRALEQWPARHFGFRSADVRGFISLLDEIIGELRVAAGETRFELNLVAVADPSPAGALLPAPGLQESISRALAVAGMSDLPTDRLSLLSAVAAVLERPPAALPGEWVRQRRREVRAALDAEIRVEGAYGRLTRRTMRDASAAASRADVGRIEELLADVRRRDALLGRQRPAALDGLLAAVQARLDAAQRLRLARDRWTIRQPAYRAYGRAVEDLIEEFDRNRTRLDAIRRLAGPDVSTLAKLAARFQSAAFRLVRIAPPAELEGVHALLVSATQLATSAVDVRTEAVRSGDASVARDASAAAAGALMLVSRARADMDALVAFPQLR